MIQNVIYVLVNALAPSERLVTNTYKPQNLNLTINLKLNGSKITLIVYKIKEPQDIPSFPGVVGILKEEFDFLFQTIFSHRST